MLISTSFQFRLLICSVLAGILTGVFFDIYRIIRGFEHINKLFIILEDALFWVFTSVVVFIFLLKTNYAYISGYVYVFIGLGIYIYMKLFSRIIIKIELATGRFFGKIFRIFFNLLLYPFRLIFFHSKKQRKMKK